MCGSPLLGFTLSGPRSRHVMAYPIAMIPFTEACKWLIDGGSFELCKHIQLYHMIPIPIINLPGLVFGDSVFESLQILKFCTRYDV